MAEHIRIALLDPKWKEKSGHLKPGEKEQTLAEHDEVRSVRGACVGRVCGTERKRERKRGRGTQALNIRRAARRGPIYTRARSGCRVCVCVCVRACARACFEVGVEREMDGGKGLVSRANSTRTPFTQR